MSDFKIKYFIDSVDIAKYKVYVSASKGILDAPKRKIAYKHSWLDESGDEVDLSTVKYEARVFELTCFVKGANIASAIANRNNLINAVDKSTYVTLKVQYGDVNDVITHKCYREDELSVLQKFRYGKNIWTFTLKLKEYFE